MSARMHLLAESPDAAERQLSPAHSLAGADSSHPQQPRAEQFAVAADVLALLADRTRLTLLHLLSNGEADVTTLAQSVDAARPAVSQHLARLRLAGLVATRKEGRRVVYSLRTDHLNRLITESLALADHLAEDRAR